MSVRKIYKFGKRIIQIIAILAILVSSAVWVGKSKATPGSAVTAQLIASGNLSNPSQVKIKAETKVNIDISQIQLWKITIAPGGYTGWHQHGGPHMIIVASGSLTYYEGDDPTCTGVVYPAGSAIMDPGFDTHFVRNEGTEDAVTYVTQLLPAGGTFRIDIPSPGNCTF